MQGQYRLNKSKVLSVGQQLFNLKNQTIGFSDSTSKSRLRWIYKTRPTSISREYFVLIDYCPSLRKKAHTLNTFILIPNLNELTTLSEDIPHLFKTIEDIKYKEGICLCLYRSLYREWTEQKHISQTIVPWVDLWLFYFESWLVSGVWEGGGEHPELSE